MTRTMIPSVIAVVLLLTSAASAQNTRRVSLTTQGAQGNGLSQGSALSADGSLVAFTSSANNLVPGDTNGVADVFVRDRRLGTTTRVSVDSSGAQSNGASAVYAQIAGDGRFVTFGSSATNLVPGDTNGKEDIFVHDLSTGHTQRVSVSATGTQGDGPSTFPTISANGRFIAFASDASNLVAGDSNGTADVFVHDCVTGSVTRVSRSSAGVEANGPTFSPSLSASGRFVAFHGTASNLVIGDVNGASDVFLHDRQTGQTECVSVNPGGTTGNGTSIDWHSPSISENGRFVAFYSLANDLVASDAGSVQDIFVRDRQSGTTSLVSVSGSGAQANRHCYYPSISADGRYVAYESGATNLASGWVDNHFHNFVHDRLLGRTERVSVNSGGLQANNSSFVPVVSADGKHVAYWSRASNLVLGDTNGTDDVFVHDVRSDFALVITGSCPGVLRISIRHGTPDGWIALIYGNAGSSVKAGPPCQGLVMSVGTARLRRLLRADAAGKVTFITNASSSHCGLTLQVVDVTNCAASNTVVL